MPAHLTHTIFAQQSLEKALGERGVRIFEEFSSVCTLGAQGPDMFLHNFRTKPSGFAYGKLLHTRGFGRFVQAMTEEAVRRKAGLASPEAGFILSYTSHAFLDRSTHPFIIYFSGWVDPRDSSTARYHQCHPFFERIIDVFVLRRFSPRELSSYDFRDQIDCGDRLPLSLSTLIADALSEAFSLRVKRETLLKKIASSYTDTMYTYSLTNPVSWDNRKKAYRQDVEENYKNRLLALFHPLELSGEIDFMNTGKSPWKNPCKEGGERRESFWELYDEASEKVLPVLAYIADAIEGKKSADDIGIMVGNANLSGGENELPCRPKRTDPLPLPELIQQLYDSFQPVYDVAAPVSRGLPLPSFGD